MKTEYKIALGLSILTSVCSMLIIAKTLKFGFILPAIAWGAIAWCYYKKNHQAVKYSLLVFGSIYAIGMAILVWGILNFSTTEFDIKNLVVLAAAVVISPAVISFQYFANEMQRREHETEFATLQQRTRVSGYVFVACVLGLMLSAIPDNKESSKVDSSIEHKTESIKICKIYWNGWEFVNGSKYKDSEFITFRVADEYGIMKLEYSLPIQMESAYEKDKGFAKSFMIKHSNSINQICTL
jgi:hypothetical protein